ncbi:MAG: hypothetical protein K2L76_05480 [Muribaculaceae bacterium]|nr:hypothetical protein [Muribaculaceae bacterium]
MRTKLIFMSFLLALACRAYDCPVCELANGPLIIRQIPGSENTVREYFKEYKDIDTIYAIVDPVGLCPRCEAVIMPVFNRIKQLKPSAKTFLIAGYHNAEAAKKYLREYQIKADFEIYDTDKAYDKFLSSNFGFIHIPYLLKIIPASGEIPLSIQAFGNSAKLIQSFLYDDIELEQKAFARTPDAEVNFKAPQDYIIPQQILPFSVPDSITLSQPHMLPDFDGNHIAFNDFLRSSVIVGTLSEDNAIHFSAEIAADSTERYRFITLSDKYTREDYDDGSLRFMPVSPRFMPDGRLGISYSLPLLREENDSTIVYANQPCVLFVDTINYEHNLLPLENGEPHGLFFGHYRIYPYGNDIAVMSQPRTWPLLPKDEFENGGSNDPTVDAYYEDKKVQAVMSARTGQFLFEACPLPEVSRASKTGHSFPKALSDTRDGAIACADGFSGKIHVEKGGTISEYDIFNIDPLSLPVPDSTKFYSYDISAMYVPYFCRYIEDMKLGRGRLTCLVRYGRLGNIDKPEAYTVVTLDLSDGSFEEKTLKAGRNAAVSAYGLRRTAGGDVQPFRLAASGSDRWVELFPVTTPQRTRSNRAPR